MDGGVGFPKTSATWLWARMRPRCPGALSAVRSRRPVGKRLRDGGPAAKQLVEHCAKAEVGKNHFSHEWTMTPMNMNKTGLVLIRVVVKTISRPRNFNYLRERSAK